MKEGDKLKIQIPEPKLDERLKGVAGIRLVLKPSSILELEEKELIFVRISSINKDWAIVRAPNGDEYEVSKQFLKEIS